MDEFLTIIGSEDQEIISETKDEMHEEIIKAMNDLSIDFSQEIRRLKEIYVKKYREKLYQQDLERKI